MKEIDVTYTTSIFTAMAYLSRYRDKDAMMKEEGVSKVHNKTFARPLLISSRDLGRDVFMKADI